VHHLKVLTHAANAYPYHFKHLGTHALRGVNSPMHVEQTDALSMQALDRRTIEFFQSMLISPEN
jgi:hypothetical protein